MEIVYFARTREEVGHASEYLSLPEAIADVNDLMDHLQQRGQNYRAAFDDRTKLRVSVNQLYVDFDHPLRDSDEVAFFPPMTGG